MNGQELFAAVLNLYSTCSSYSDKGLCIPQDPGDPPIAFETYFKRPDSFRFRWVSRHSSAHRDAAPFDSVIFTDGVDFTEFFTGKLRKAESLAMLAAGATGVSRGAVHMILNILLPEPLEINHHWHRMTSIEMLSDELIDGVSYFHLVGTVQQPADIALWVDKEQLTIRRLREISSLSEEAAAELNEEMTGSKAAEMLMAMFKEDGMDENQAKILCEQVGSNVMGPSEWTTVYDYLETSISQPLDDELFRKL